MKTLLVLLLFIPSLSWGFFGPDNFNECRVKYSKNVETERGASNIARACNILFKKENPTSNQKKFAKCIIKETPKQKSDRGATAVMRHCREKYLNK